MVGLVPGEAEVSQIVPGVQANALENKIPPNSRSSQVREGAQVRAKGWLNNNFGISGVTKGSGPLCWNGPKGASHKRVLTPLSR